MGRDEAGQEKSVAPPHLLSWKGYVPVSMMYNTTPRAHTSAAAPSYGRQTSTSGLTYAGLPFWSLSSGADGQSTSAPSRSAMTTLILHPRMRVHSR